MDTITLKKYIWVQKLVGKQSIVVALLALLLSACAATPTPPQVSTKDTFNTLAEADSAYQQGRWFEAEQGYRKIIKQVPQDYHAWFRLANTQLRQGHVEEAIHLYDQARRRNPEQSKPHYNLSTAYLLMSLQALAEADQRLRENDPAKKMIAKRISLVQSLIKQPVDRPRKLSQVKPFFGSTKY